VFKGIVFDLDGTLIDSSLSLDEVRKDIGAPPKTPILEYINQLTARDKFSAEAIVVKHELRAAEHSVLNPGVDEVLSTLFARGIEIGLFTRNCKRATDRVIERFGLKFNGIATRDCAPPKPDPAGLIEIVRNWGMEFGQALYVGDFLFDVQVGQKAGVKTALYIPRGLPPYADQADFIFSHFSELRHKILELRL